MIILSYKPYHIKLLPKNKNEECYAWIIINDKNEDKKSHYY